jgi:hypothetical protein
MFNEPTIESLSKDVQNLKSTVKRLEDKLNAYDSSPYLDRNLDNQSKDILHQEVSKRIMDIVWDDYYHYHTFFEAVGTTGTNYGWIVSSSGANTGVDSTGLFLETGTSTGNEAFVLKAPLYQNILSFDLESRFRTSFYVDSVSNIRVFIGGGNGTSGGTLTVNLNYYGFYLENNTLYGVTSNGSTGSRVALMTVVANNLYLLEARYVPGNKATFYVSDGTTFPSIPSINTRAKERGSLTTTLPSGDGTLTRFQIETRENAEKNLGIGFYEYIQQKIKP